MYAQPVPTLHGLHIAVWPLLLLSVRPLYHANKWPGLKKERTQIWSELETESSSLLLLLLLLLLLDKGGSGDKRAKLLT